MTASLRFTVPLGLEDVLLRVAGADSMPGHSSKRVNIWQGAMRPIRDAIAVSIKLPCGVEYAYRLFVELCEEGRKTARTLRLKLSSCLGLPYGGVILRAEMPFLDAISDKPADHGNWMAYGDWLADRREEFCWRRGEIIQSLFGPRPAKTRYGLLLLAWGLYS